MEIHGAVLKFAFLYIYALLLQPCRLNVQHLSDTLAVGSNLFKLLALCMHFKVSNSYHHYVPQSCLCLL